MSSGLLPFIFARLTKESQEKINFGGNPIIKDWVVMIAQHDLVIEDHGWMNDIEIGKYCYVPHIDIAIENDHVFTTFDEARSFVKEWWSQNE